MLNHPTDRKFELLREEFDGACDPAFDNTLEELERQFAELRISQARDLN
jgi:hypothetical protein